MAYATLDDVLNAAPKLQVSATTKPSTTDAQAIVDRVDAEVNGVLKGLGYITPVIGAASIQILKDIVVQGAVARILKAMFYGVRNPDEVGATDAWREYQGKLKAIADPEDPLTLPDAQVSVAAEKSTTPVRSSVIDELGTFVDEYRPTRDMVF